MRYIAPELSLRILSSALLSLILIQTSCQVKENEHEKFHQSFEDEQNLHFKDSKNSPLMVEELNDFQFINYYPYIPAYRVEARWVLTPDMEPFPMPTSTARSPMYRKYGELHFELDGRELVLSAYRSMDLMNEPEFENHLFIPFNDLTNSVTTYGGGRYIDFSIPHNELVALDFNNSCHPYCAYNHKYSCPIPPDENVLDVAIEAGVKSGLNGKVPVEH